MIQLLGVVGSLAQTFLEGKVEKKNSRDPENFLRNTTASGN